MVLAGFVFLLTLTSRLPAAYPGTSLAGDWDGEFNGVVVERSDGERGGDSQREVVGFSLRQSGAAVTGELIFGEGWPYELRIPLTGTLEGKQFNYRAELHLGDCLFVVEAKTTLNPSANRFFGQQTQSNCEGRAVGQIAADRRKGVNSP